jgi:hypothetical protein
MEEEWPWKEPWINSGHGDELAYEKRCLVVLEGTTGAEA